MLAAACTSVTVIAPAPVPADQAAKPPADNRARAVQQRGSRARWVAADWSELPGWGEDHALELWPALLRGCARPAPGWAEACARASLANPADDAEAALWLMQHLQPWQVQAADGGDQGLMTGYFEPALEARRKPEGSFRIPVLAAPADLKQRQPSPTRQQIEQAPP
ncbi:MltA domain-containing protein, partial [Pelomonas sp. KK5]|uniref:MltA domain-containing protein n=1 Tax=Pelomonas sp. KK5 TaxID=1855730 RepID=UPI0018EA1658